MSPGLLQQIISLLVVNFAELCFFGAIMLALQWWLPAWRGQKNWDQSARLDIAYSFILAFCTPFFLAVPIALVEALLNLSPELSVAPRAMGQSWPLAVQVFVAVLIIDLVGYWRHRIMHMKWLWPIHAIHHCSNRLNWLSTERFHPLNYFITAFINTIFVQILFGPEVALIGALLRRLYNFYIHANVSIDYGILGYILVSPRFHHWHHSVDKAAADKNYCTFFSCIDLAFGTFYLPRDKVPAGGVGIEEIIPENLTDQFLYPFRTWRSWLWPRTEPTGTDYDDR